MVLGVLYREGENPKRGATLGFPRIIASSVENEKSPAADIVRAEEEEGDNRKRGLFTSIPFI